MNDDKGQLLQKVVMRAGEADEPTLQAMLTARHQAEQKFKLLQTKEVAAELDFHPETIKRLAREGKIPVVRFSCRKIRFKSTDIERIRRNGFEVV